MISALASNRFESEDAIQPTNIEGMVIGPDLVLLTYVSDWQGRRARRSSLCDDQPAPDAELLK
jgi:hypothetical protein